MLHITVMVIAISDAMTAPIGTMVAIGIARDSVSGEAAKCCAGNNATQAAVTDGAPN